LFRQAEYAAPCAPDFTPDGIAAQKIPVTGPVRFKKFFEPGVADALNLLPMLPYQIVCLFIHVSAILAADIPARGTHAPLLIKSFVCIDFSRYFCDSYFIHLLIIAKLRPPCTLFYRITFLSSGCESADTQV
jgi:hypothetical protein